MASSDGNAVESGDSESSESQEAKPSKNGARARAWSAFSVLAQFAGYAAGAVTFATTGNEVAAEALVAGGELAANAARAQAHKARQEQGEERPHITSTTTTTYAQPEASPSPALVDLNMKDSLRAAIQCSDYDRIVIFIDDLDRLDPRFAVELLEGVKNFMDCEGCVFVLALDEKVVFDGIVQKFGPERGEERKRVFFDKIIQIPFRMPVERYNITEYTTRLFGKLGVALDESGAAHITRLFATLDPDQCKNPRTVKRYINLASLYSSFTFTDSAEKKGSGLTTDNVMPLLVAAILNETAHDVLRDIIHLSNEDKGEGLRKRSEQLDDASSTSSPDQDDSDEDPTAITIENCMRVCKEGGVDYETFAGAFQTISYFVTSDDLMSISAFLDLMKEDETLSELLMEKRIATPQGLNRLLTSMGLEEDSSANGKNGHAPTQKGKKHGLVQAEDDGNDYAPRCLVLADKAQGLREYIGRYLSEGRV